MPAYYNIYCHYEYTLKAHIVRPTVMDRVLCIYTRRITITTVLALSRASPSISSDV